MSQFDDGIKFHGQFPEGTPLVDLLMVRDARGQAAPRVSNARPVKPLPIGNLPRVVPGPTT